ncbi:MAG: GGDEF domain-containing protein [Campylobacterota bacterium]|nr:GGDEF domain-containing protein [Campylobacterota bacterium]
MKQKIISKLILVMVIVGILLAIVESYNFRTYGIKTAINKATSISEAVQSGLTAHMINGNMENRDVFINSISNMKNVEDLWIIRGANVNKQYGDPKTLEISRDDIDQEVLKSSKMKYLLQEGISKTTLRVTIPYKATKTNTINCINCHNVQYGDTLGAISIVLDISDIRDSGLKLILSILVSTTIAILLVVFVANKILKPHLETLEELSKKIKNISNGIFTNIIPNKNLSIEAKHLISQYNQLINGLSTTFTDIDKKLNIFVGNKNYNTNNPLLNSQKIIGNLADIYQFKKEIEIDETKDDIYNRLAQILINRFKLNNFTFMELSFNDNKSVVVYSQSDKCGCSESIMEHPEYCRVSKNTNDVSSVQSHKVCKYFNNQNDFYYCISIDIGDQAQLVVNFILDSNESLNLLKQDISLIKSYFLEAAPSLIVNLLLEELKTSAFKDGLTSLYNRKFLDEHITKLVPQALREKINIGVLMLDMDHFKAVNDEYGHDVGDIALKELGKILIDNVRDSDIVVRYGGEEFIILLVGVDGQNAAIEVANKIRNQVSKNEINVYAGNKLRKTISVGLSMFPQDSNNFDLVMKNADIALYEAKDSGRDKVVRYKDKVDIELF